MPNGGPDNCSTCGFNRRNRGVWRNPKPDESTLPYCEIRSMAVLADHWTYCQNWHTRTNHPIGPIYSSGLYDSGYHRIPWHGAIEPGQIASGVCSICRQSFRDGLEILAVEGHPIQFCSNRHYLQWWKQQHPNEDASMSGELSGL